jgi:hypothetical protein
VSIERGRLKQSGILHKGIDLPFTIPPRSGTTPDGRLRLHPTSVKVAGIGVTGLMRVRHRAREAGERPAGRGVEIDGNDFLLEPAGLLPPRASAAR